MRFKSNGRKYTKETLDETVENIANQAVLNLTQPIAQQNVSNPGEQGVTPAVGNATVPLPMGPPVTSIIATPNGSPVIQPVPTGTPIVPTTVSTALAPVTSVDIQTSGFEALLSTSSITGVSPTAQIPMQSASAFVPAPAPLPGASVLVQPASTMAPSIATGIPVPSPVPAPFPGAGLPVFSGGPGVPAVSVSQTSSVMINPSPVASVTVGVVSLHHKVQFTYQVWLEPIFSLPRKSNY